MKTKSEIDAQKAEQFINGGELPSVNETVVKTTKTSRLKDPNTMVYQVFLPRELQTKIKKAAILNDMTINDFYLDAVQEKLNKLGPFELFELERKN